MAKDSITYPSLITQSVTDDSLITEAIVDDSLITDSLTENSPIGIEDETPPGPVIPSGSIARWDGGSILDTSGSANVYDGTLGGSPLPSKSVGINGVADTAYKFVSANSQFANFGNIIDLEGVQKFTISTWLKKTSSDTMLIGALNSVTDGTHGFWIQWLNSTVVFCTARNGGSPSISNSLADGSWESIIFIYDYTEPVAADRFKLYFNGVRVGSVGTAVDSSTPSLGFDFQFARFWSTNYNDGEVGPTTLYARAINQSEVDQLVAEKTV